jgi:hypothetical protein
MSNLQCPVTMILAPPSDPHRLAVGLRHERISTIWSDPQVLATQTAEAVAAELGVPDLRVQAATRIELESLADECRGETVLGIVPEPVLVDLLGRLFPNQPGSRPVSAGSCRVSYDGDTWTLNRTD